MKSNFRGSALGLYLLNARLGLVPFLGGVPYSRYIEYPLALSLAGDMHGKRILDIGSGRRARFPLYLLSNLSAGHVFATDINDYGDSHARLAERVRPASSEVRFSSEPQDATELSYDDSQFDVVFALSTVEHIPGEGDSIATAEIGRVLRPGGVAVISVPFTSGGHKEEFRRFDVAGREHDDEVFYERTYDAVSVEARLLEPLGLEPVERVFFGEPSFQFWSVFYYRLLVLPPWHQWLTLPFRATMPLLSSVFLDQVESEHPHVLGVVIKASSRAS